MVAAMGSRPSLWQIYGPQALVYVGRDLSWPEWLALPDVERR